MHIDMLSSVTFQSRFKSESLFVSVVNRWFIKRVCFYEV